ncbi:hypothetical protein C8Q76DRAFT_292334 [Earliella scabrosa]|nr:hypothetical protein C8Q76DRAFT_292334 [Earliella scabrosa]
MSTPAVQPPQSILVLGAGELGSAILSALAAHPALQHTTLTVLLRPSTLSTNPAQLAALRALIPTHSHKELQFTSADLSAPTAADDLAKVLAEGAYDTVVAATGFGGGEGTQRAIAEAVMRNGAGRGGRVRRYVPWQFGVDYDAIGPEAADGLFKEQCGVREVLRAQGGKEEGGVEWVIVSTGMFMSFVFEEWFGVVEGLAGGLKGEEKGTAKGEVRVRALGSWANGVTLTAAEDIGKVVADVLARPVERNDRGGSIVYTAGQTVTYRELADVVEKVVGGRRRVVREEWTVDYLTEELRKDPGNQLKKYRLLFAGGKGLMWDMEKTINFQRGIKTTGVEEWLRERLSN